MLEPTSYSDLVEDYERTTASLRLCAEAEQQHLLDDVRRNAEELVRATSGASLQRLAIWHVDYFYRLLHRVDSVDRASFLFVRAVGQPLNEALAMAGTAIAYLVDNEIPHDRLVPGARFFGAMGRMVASPELIAAELARADGVPVEDVTGPHLPAYLAEATVVALRLAERAITRRDSFLWISGSCSIDVYQALASRLDEPYTGVFRNHPPEEGSTVQVFRGLGSALPIDPQY
jgi:hypothetical protein